MSLGLLTACEGPQSALDPAGSDAETLADLFWIMLVGAVVLWLLVNGLAFFLTRVRPRAFSPKLGHALIIGGGVAFPTVVLAGLLSYAFTIMPEMRQPASDPNGVRLRVVGEQFWWRVFYERPGEAPVVAANEVRLPVGARTEIALTSDEVIHSFWVPALAGKIDMFPGRETWLSLEPVRAGTYRGQCAELCGESHALMAFATVAMEPDAFADWLDREAAPARLPETDAERAGERVFLSAGCGACHAVRGTEARGTFGPDLTHVGGRETLGAGILPNDARALRRWIAHTEEIKPGVSMPSYDHLDEAELVALSAYLEGLR